MARNVVKDYLEYEKQNLKNYISIITNKKLNNNLCDMIIDTYIDIRYFNAYTSVKKNLIDNIEYYVFEKFKKSFVDDNVRKNVVLMLDALIVIRYLILFEKYNKDENAKNGLLQYEQKVYGKYKDTNILITDLIKDIKTNYHKKEKFLEELLSTDFSVDKKETNIKDVYETILDNNVKIPDLFSDFAVNRVYNSGTINEDKMLVYYTLLSRMILLDMIDYNYTNKYLISFPESIIDRDSKLNNLLSIIDLEYLKERVVMIISYHDYKEKKDSYDFLIHKGYSFAVIIDEEVKDDLVMFNIFSYILVENPLDEKIFNTYNNVIKI